MTGKDIFKAINALDDELIADAYVVEKEAAKPRLLAFRYAAAAAVIVLAVLTAILLGRNKLPVTPVPTENHTTAFATEPASTSGKTAADAPESSQTQTTDSGTESQASQTVSDAPTTRRGTRPTEPTTPTTVPRPVPTTAADEPTLTVPTTVPTTGPTQAPTTAEPTAPDRTPTQPTTDAPTETLPAKPIPPEESRSHSTVTNLPEPKEGYSGIVMPAVGPQASSTTAPTEEPGAELTESPTIEAPAPPSEQLMIPLSVSFNGQSRRLQSAVTITADMVGSYLGTTADGRSVFACLTDSEIILVVTDAGLRAYK